MGSPEKIYLGVLLLLLLASAYPLRRNISYPFCSLERYRGKIGKGRSTQILVLNALASLFIGMAILGWISRASDWVLHLEKPFIRITSFLCLWIFWFLILGMGIDQYLRATDPEFKQWNDQFRKRKQKDSRRSV